MKKLFLILVVVLGGSLSAKAGIKLPGYFNCTTASQGTTTFEGYIPKVPGQGVFKINGSPVKAKWEYKANCFISRAGQQICSEPNELAISVLVPASGSPSGFVKYNGGIEIYAQSAYAHLMEVEPTLAGKHVSFSCVWQ